MRLLLVKDLRRRACIHELLQYPAGVGGLCSCGKLAVGERSGSAFAELYVAFRVQRTSVPEALHGSDAFFHAAAAFQHYGAQTVLRQSKSRKHAAGAESYYCGTAFRMPL